MLSIPNPAPIQAGSVHITSRRSKNLSPPQRLLQKRAFNTPNKLSSDASYLRSEQSQFRDPSAIALDYKSYLASTKTSLIKSNYTLLINEKISQVRKLKFLLVPNEHNDAKPSVSTKGHSRRVKENIEKEQEVLRKVEAERIEKERIIAEEKRKEILKQQSIQEWMVMNKKQFDEKRTKIQMEIEELRLTQLKKSELGRKAYLERHRDIMQAMENFKKIGQEIQVIDQKRVEVLKEIRDRELANSPDPSAKTKASEIIKERLSQSPTIQLINDCFLPIEDSY